MTTIFTFATLDLVKVFHAQLARAGFCVILVFIAFLLPARRVVYAQNPPAADPANEIIVVFKTKPTVSLITTLSASSPQDLEVKNGIAASNAVVFTVNSGNVSTAMNNLSSDPNVAAVFPNYKLHLLSIPNDPEAIATPPPGLPRDQWYLFNLNLAGTGQSAWDITTGSPRVVAAVIDTGVQSDHADFKNTDGSSKFDSLVDCTGTSCQQVTTLTDNDAKRGHGTAVAGLIGAATNNGNGIAASGYNTKIMAIRIMDTAESTTQDKLINALAWAADHGAKVINLSVGVVADSLTADAVKQYDDAVAYAWNKGAVVVSAAGNCAGNTQGNKDCAIYQNGNTDTIAGYAQNSKLYPAASPNVISVAALTVNNTLASYSEHNDSTNTNIGNWVDVAAPGGEGLCTSATKTCILSLVPVNQMSWFSGTSLASPQVAGTAALLFAVNSNLTNAQVKSIIENTANSAIASGSTNHGMINALAAVQQAGTTVAVTATPTPIGNSPSATPTNCAQPTQPVCTNGTLVQITPPDTGVCFKVTCVITTPTITPTSGPTATPTVTPYPTTAPKLPRQFPSPMPAGPYCPVTIITGLNQCISDAKLTGDANCDGKVDINDYNLWTQQFDTFVPAAPVNQNSNFMCVEGNTSTYFVDLVDFEIWRRNTISGLTIPGPTQSPSSPTAGPINLAQVNLALIPAQTSFSRSGTQTLTLQATFTGGSAAQKLDFFTAEIDFSKDILMMPDGQYIDTSQSGFKKIIRVDGPTQANGSGKIMIALGADVPGGGPGTDKTITIATIKLQGKAQSSSSQSISFGKTQIVNNQSQALTISTAGTTYTVQ